MSQTRKKNSRKIFLIIGSILVLLLLFLFFAWKKFYVKEAVDYAIFPKNGVLTGEMVDGRQLFLVRENDSVDMSGYGFIYDGRAVVKPFSFRADTRGNIIFSSDELTSNGNVSLKKLSDQMLIQFPKVPEKKIDRQEIKMKYLYTIEDELNCIFRYKDPITEDVVSHTDLEYGKAMGYYASKPLDDKSEDEMKQIRKVIVSSVVGAFKGRDEVVLDLDIYEPANDKFDKRPVLLLIHGGAFFFGDKQNMLQRKIAEYFVERGYVAVSINYRLGSPMLAGTKSVERMIYRGVKDTRAAMRFLNENADKYRIDVDQIYLNGTSAGAIIALATTFMDEDEIYESVDKRLNRSDLGEFNCSPNSDDKKFNIAGLISMWGGVVDLNIIDERDKDIPTLLFHGTNDKIVYCDAGLPFQEEFESKIYNKISESWCVYGSKAIYTHMTAHDMPVQFVPFFGYGHEPQIDPDGSYNSNMETILAETNNFLYPYVLNHFMPCDIAGSVSISASDRAPFYNIESEQELSTSWIVDGGIIINNKDDRKQIVWFDTTTEGKITARVSNKQGLSCQKELTVNIISDLGN